MKFAKVLAELMDKHNITAYKMHKLLGVSQTTIKNWTTGVSAPVDEVVLKIASHFGVSLDYLITGKEFSQNSNAGDLSQEQEKVMVYYCRLGEESKDYIKGEMVRLHREEESVKGGEELSSTLESLERNA